MVPLRLTATDTTILAVGSPPIARNLSLVDSGVSGRMAPVRTSTTSLRGIMADTVVAEMEANMVMAEMKANMKENTRPFVTDLRHNLDPFTTLHDTIPPLSTMNHTSGPITNASRTLTSSP